VGHQHARHPCTIVEPEHDLAAAILRRRLTLDVRQPRDDTRRECRPKLLRQVGHGLEVHDTLAIDPCRKLASAIARRAELCREVFHLRRQHSYEVLSGHRTKNNTVIVLQNRHAARSDASSSRGRARPSGHIAHAPPPTSCEHPIVLEAQMLLFSFLVAILGSIALVIVPAFAQAPVSPFATSPGVSSGISPSVTGSLTPSLTPGLIPSINPSVTPSLVPGFAPPVNPVITPSMTGGIPGTLGGTPNVSGGSITGGIPGTLGATPFQSGSSITGALPGPSTFGTTGTTSTSPVGAGAFGGATGTGR